MELIVRSIWHNARVSQVEEELRGNVSILHNCKSLLELIENHAGVLVNICLAKVGSVLNFV